MGNDLIKYELLLVVVAVVAFAVWQWISLKRDGEALRARREAERRAEPPDDRRADDPDGGPPAKPP